MKGKLSALVFLLLAPGCANVGDIVKGQALMPSSRLHGMNSQQPLNVGETTGFLYFLDGEQSDMQRIDLPKDKDIVHRSYGLEASDGLAIDRHGNIFQSSPVGNNEVVEFDRKLRTIRTIQFGGSVAVNAITVDGDGLLYAFLTAPLSIEVFSKHATGSAKPIRTIAGNQTGLAGVSALSVDAAGELLVANAEGSIEVFAPGANGNVAPERVIAGDQTGLDQPCNLTVGADGNMYVANQLPGSQAQYDILVFPTSANGNVAPLRSLQSGEFGFSIALGTGGEMYLSGNRSDVGAFAVYAPGASGNDQPIGYVGKGFTNKYVVSPFRAVLVNSWFFP